MAYLNDPISNLYKTFDFQFQNLHILMYVPHTGTLFTQEFQKRCSVTF